MKLLKIFFLFCRRLILKTFKSNAVVPYDDSQIIRAEMEILEKELDRIREDQKVILEFCRDSLIKKVKQIDVLSKNILVLDEKIEDSNGIITQHANVINDFIAKYREHLADTQAHSYEPEYELESKDRKDN